MKEIQEVKRAEVLLYFEIDDRKRVNFVIENIGKKVANNVKIRVLENEVFGEDGNYSLGAYVLKNGIPLIPPHKTLKNDFVYMFSLMHEKEERLKVKFEIEYEDKNQTYKDEVNLDLNIFREFS